MLRGDWYSISKTYLILGDQILITNHILLSTSKLQAPRNLSIPTSRTELPLSSDPSHPAHNHTKMKPPARIPFRLLPRAAGGGSGSICGRVYLRPLHHSTAKPADVAPILGTGPPPDPPVPSGEYPQERLARRKRQAEMLKQAREFRGGRGPKGAEGGMKRRFWEHVTVEEVDGEFSSPGLPFLCALALRNRADHSGALLVLGYWVKDC